jgi:hypothetical protein
MIQTLEVDVKENKDGSATLLLEMDANTKGLFVQAALKGLVWEINESMEVQEPSDPEGSELVELPTKAVNSLITYAIQNALAKGLSGSSDPKKLGQSWDSYLDTPEEDYLLNYAKAGKKGPWN